MHPDRAPGPAARSLAATSRCSTDGEMRKKKKLWRRPEKCCVPVVATFPCVLGAPELWKVHVCCTFDDRRRRGGADPASSLPSEPSGVVRFVNVTLQMKTPRNLKLALIALA